MLPYCPGHCQISAIGHGAAHAVGRLAYVLTLVCVLLVCRYGQAGTPQVKVSPSYDASARTLTLKVSQHIPPTPGQSQKAPVPIPLAVGLLAADGSDMPLHLQVGMPGPMCTC